MLSPSLCGAVVAVLLLPALWTLVASALRALLHRRRDASLSDAVEKLVLALLLAPSLMGAAAMLAGLLPASPSAPPPLLHFDFAESAASVAPAAPQAAPRAHFPWMLAAMSAFAWIYAAGAIFAGLRLIAVQLRLRRIAARGEDASALWGARVVVADTETSAFVGGDKIVLPRRLLAALTPAQVALVIAHERSHVRRGDALYFAALAWIDALCWFNPLMRAQTQRCRLAAELACDAAVTARAPEMRRAYAQALLAALKHTAGDALPCAPAVFSTRIVGEHRMRIGEIMRGAAVRRKRAAWGVYAAAGLVAAPLFMLQLAAAQPNAVSAAQSGAVSAAQPGAVSAAPQHASLFSAVPSQGAVVSVFGERRDPASGLPAVHSGLDFQAPEGAPIVAAGAGRVALVAERPYGYGKMIEIDHGAGLMTRYAHLSAFEVSEGQLVSAGQEIGRVGNTGRSIGAPHLHFEVLRDGAAVDPAPLLPSAR